MKPMIYVAGPYTGGDPVLNTRNAIQWGERLWKWGAVPLVPHLTLLWHLSSPHDVDFWYELDLRQLEHCDALLRLPGDSSGADREVTHARDLGLPTWYVAAYVESDGIDLGLANLRTDVKEWINAWTQH